MATQVYPQDTRPLLYAVPQPVVHKDVSNGAGGGSCWYTFNSIATFLVLAGILAVLIFIAVTPHVRKPPPLEVSSVNGATVSFFLSHCNSSYSATPFTMAAQKLLGSLASFIYVDAGTSCVPYGGNRGSGPWQVTVFVQPPFYYSGNSSPLQQAEIIASAINSGVFAKSFPEIVPSGATFAIGAHTVMSPASATLPVASLIAASASLVYLL